MADDKIKKGIAVLSDEGDGETTFRFLDDGTSKIGKDVSSEHTFAGTVTINDTLDIQGEAIFDKRIGGYKFGLPLLDGKDDKAILDELDSNSGNYSGYMFYLDNAHEVEESETTPFEQPQKIYFCEGSVWFASPFFSEEYEQEEDDV